MTNVNPVSVVAVNPDSGIPTDTKNVKSGKEDAGDVSFYKFDSVSQIAEVYSDEQICYLFNIQEKTSRQNLQRQIYALEHDGKVSKQMLIDAVMAGDSDRIAELQKILKDKQETE